MAPVTGVSRWSKLNTGMAKASNKSRGISVTSIGTNLASSSLSSTVLLGTDRKALNGAAMLGKLKTLIGERLACAKYVDEFRVAAVNERPMFYYQMWNDFKDDGNPRKKQQCKTFRG